MFVLPTNVYPSTDSVANDVIAGTFGNRLRVIVGEALRRRERESPASPAAQLSNGADGVSNAAGKQLHSTAGSGAAVESPRWRIPLSGINPVRIVKRTFTPIRLLFIGMLLAVGATGYWIHHENQQEAARGIWRDSTDDIPQLLAARDFESLHDTLVAATNAGRLLDQDGPEWRRIRNLLQETQAVTSVSYKTLPALFSDASDAESPATDFIPSQYFVIDGYIDPVGDSDEMFVVDIPVMSDQHPIRVTLKLPQLKEYLQQNDSRRFVFGFQLNSIDSHGPSATGVRELRAVPESFVLLTSEEHCYHMGLSAQLDLSLSEILTRQRAFVEESVSWENRHAELIRIANRSHQE